MLYTFLFGVASFVLSCAVGTIFGFDSKRSGGYLSFPSSYAMFVGFCTFLGAAIGFGYGADRLLTGHYWPF
jgi:hypothetical protein